MKMSAIEAAEQYIHQHFPDCMLAVLGGSGSRNEMHAYSDLDIVIVNDSDGGAYRQTVKAFDWIIECFVLTSESYREMFDEGIFAANPTLQRILHEGIVIKCEPAGKPILEEARDDLAYGPMIWSDIEIDRARYEITEYMEDLKGSSLRSESFFIVNKLSVLLCQFRLRVDGKWLGEGKHLYRYVQAHDRKMAEQLESALELFYVHNKIEALLALCELVLAPYGGTLLEGYEDY